MKTNLQASIASHNPLDAITNYAEACLYFKINPREKPVELPYKGLEKLARDIGLPEEVVKDRGPYHLNDISSLLLEQFPVEQALAETINLSRLLLKVETKKRVRAIVALRDACYLGVKRQGKLNLPDFKPYLSLMSIPLNSWMTQIVKPILGKKYEICQRGECNNPIPEGRRKYCCERCSRIVNRDQGLASRIRRLNSRLQTDAQGNQIDFSDTKVRLCLGCKAPMLTDRNHRVCDKCSRRNTEHPETNAEKNILSHSVLHAALGASSHEYSSD